MAITHKHFLLREIRKMLDRNDLADSNRVRLLSMLAKICRGGQLQERNRKADDAVRSQELSDGSAEVERFLSTRIGLQYEPDDNNKRLMLDYLHKHKLALSAENLVTAFNLLKSQLKLSDKITSHNGTMVIDFGSRNENSSFISTELRDSIRRKIARYGAEQYREWLMSHPDEAEILNGQ